MFVIDYIITIKMRTNVLFIQLVQDISLKIFWHETYDSNPFSGFGYGLIKCQLRIECQTRCLCLGQLFNDDVIERYRRMGWFIPFAREYHLNCLLFTSGLNSIFHWKAYCLITLRSLFKTIAEVSSSYTTIKRLVYSVKSLASELTLSTRSSIETKKNNGLKTEPWDFLRWVSHAADLQTKSLWLN